MNTGQNRWMIVFAAAGVAALVVVTVASVFLGKARVTGDTPAERIESISRLAARGASGAGRAIARAAVNDPDPKVKQVAVISLGKLLAPEHRTAVESCTHDRDAGVRSAAAGTLVLYADDAAVERLVEMALQDPAPQARLDSMTALAQSKADRAVVTLVEAMERGADEKTRVHAVTLLARRYGLNDSGLTPAAPARWLRVIEAIKGAPGVEDAFKRLSRPLKRNLQHRVRIPAQH